MIMSKIKCIFFNCFEISVEKLYLSSRKNYLECSSRIRIFPPSRIRIPDPDPQHCTLMCIVQSFTPSMVVPLRTNVGMVEP